MRTRTGVVLLSLSLSVGVYAEDKPAVPAAAPAPAAAAATTTAVSLQTMAEELYASLTPEQKPRATLPFNSPEKDSEVFPGGVRPGIPLNDLAEPQRNKAIAMLSAFTSDYGKKKIEEVSQQDNPKGLGGITSCSSANLAPAKPTRGDWRSITSRSCTWKWRRARRSRSVRSCWARIRRRCGTMKRTR